MRLTMEMLPNDPTVLLAIAAIFTLAGFTKGAIGFALPLIAVSGTSMVLPAQAAVASVLLPILASNTVQALQGGRDQLGGILRRFGLSFAVMGLCIWLSAPLLTTLEDRAFFLLLGLLTGGFALIQLLGWRPRISARAEFWAGLVCAVIGGFFGGLSGIWGPPFILLFTALDLPRDLHIQTTGVCFFIGSAILFPAHLATGVLNAQTLPLSVAALVPTFLGYWLGMRLRYRIDAAMFRRLTLVALLLSAANLLRKALV